MSKTVGATVRPVANDVPVTPMLMNPVLLYRHPPWRSGDPCSWYCHRALTAGFQQWPADWLQGTGVGICTALERTGLPCAGAAVRPRTSSPIDSNRSKPLLYAPAICSTSDYAKYSSAVWRKACILPPWETLRLRSGSAGTMTTTIRSRTSRKGSQRSRCACARRFDAVPAGAGSSHQSCAQVKGVTSSDRCVTIHEQPT